MSEIVKQAPHFNEADAVRIALELFDLDVSAKLLPSERDQNFHLTASTGDAYVLKIANAAERIEVLEFQNQAMMHIADKHGNHSGSVAVGPLVCKTPLGEQITSVKAGDNTTHYVRLLTYLPGKPLAKVKPHDASLLESLGRFFGILDFVFEDFDHLAAHRNFHWDLSNAGQVISNMIDEIDDAVGRNTVARFLNRFQKKIEPQLVNLRRQVIHNDGNYDSK